MNTQLRCSIEKGFPSDFKGEGHLLPMMLSAAVPLWALDFQTLSDEERLQKIKQLDNSDFCLRMEYVLHKGPKPGDSAQAFNDLAKTIALLSFSPGGVCCFGTRYEWIKEEKTLRYTRNR